MHKIAIISTSVALALGTLSSVALAEPVELTEAQMHQVTAGYFKYDPSNILYDIFNNSYTPDSAGNFSGSDGWTWSAPFGIYYAPDGRAYGALYNGSYYWDGSCSNCW